MRVLIAPDSFKGSLTSVEVAQALARRLAAGAPRRRASGSRRSPTAARGRWSRSRRPAAGSGATPRPTTRWAGRSAPDGWRRDDGAVAFVEMATASGLSLVAAGERDAARATSEGTGDVLRAVLDAGIRDISLGIGGSATTDGGAGLLRALGARVSDDLTAVDLAGLDPRLAETRLRIACDVTNPLLGERGAAATYGPQKGATPDDVPVLDARLARFADALDAATGRSERDTAGAGAAGGVGFGLLCARGPVRKPHAGTRHRPRHGRHRLRRCARERRPRDHRRGPDRRADGVRQDGARRGAARAGGRQAMRRGRRGRDARAGSTRSRQ